MSDNGPVTADVLAWFSPAVKEQLKALVAIDGPTGAGKTFTALQAARILAGPDGDIAFIDTENRTALHYAAAPGEAIQRLNFWDPPYQFRHMSWKPPYDPVRLTDMVQALQSHVDVICLDSLTHFWTGEGGTLDIVDAAAARASGNTFVGWKEGSPIQRHMLDTFIHAECHLIITMRSKMEYVIEDVVVRSRDGKERTVKQPRKLGLSPEQRASIEYEFNVVADMDTEHKLIVSKTRCSLLTDRVAPKGRSAEIWTDYAGWLDTGIAMPTQRDVDEFVAQLNAIPDPGVRKAVKIAVAEQFGMPDRMTLEQMVAARLSVADALAIVPPETPPEGPGQDDGIGAPDQPGSTEPTSDAPTPTDPGEATTAPAPDLTPEQAAEHGVSTRAYTEAELQAMGPAEQLPIGPTPPPPVEGVIAGAVAKQNRRAAKSA